jgi:adenine deaminase
MALASDGQVIWEAALPLAGQMTPGPFAKALSAARGLKKHLQGAGYPFSDPLYSLLFLTADFLPGPRLMWSGVLDTRSQKVIHEVEPIDV